MTLFDALFNVVMIGLLAGFVIWIVGKLHLGMEVDGFGVAFIASFVIAIIGGLINWLLAVVGIVFDSRLLGGIVNLVVAAVVLLLSGRILPGMRVRGFTGALLAAVCIGIGAALIVYWRSMVGV
jgi:putative membrane protein